MDTIGTLLRLLTTEYSNEIRILIAILFCGLFVSEFKKIVSLSTNVKSVIILLELAIVFLLMIICYHSFIEYFKGTLNGPMHINPFLMLVIFILTTIISGALYLTALYIIKVLELHGVDNR